MIDKGPIMFNIMKKSEIDREEEGPRQNVCTNFSSYFYWIKNTI